MPSMEGVPMLFHGSSPIRRLHKGRSISDFGSPSSKFTRRDQEIRKSEGLQRGKSATLDSNGSYNDDSEDSEIDDLCHISKKLLAFPLPPINSSRPNLRQARSMTAMSSNFLASQHAPLRQRRCKTPLSIKTNETLKQRPRGRKASLSSILSPPPCPPPSTPLPDIPTAGGVIGHPEMIYKGQADQLDWDWDHATSAVSMEPQSSSSSSSSSTSPASTKGSSSTHHYRSSRSFPLTPTDAIQAPLSSLDPKQTITPNLALEMALHLHLGAEDHQHTELFTFTTKDVLVNSQDDDYNYVYGFAL